MAKAEKLPDIESEVRNKRNYEITKLRKISSLIHPNILNQDWKSGDNLLDPAQNNTTVGLPLVDII